MLKTLLRRFHSPVGLTLGKPVQMGKKETFSVEDVAQVLENDPNLEAFYDAETIQQVKKFNSRNNSVIEPIDDEYNFSLIEGMEKFEDVSFSPSNVTNTNDMPQTMKTEDFIKLLNKDGEIAKMSSSQIQPKPSSIPRVDPYSSFKSFLTSLESPTKNPLKIKHLDQLVNTELPLIVISKLRNPTLNLAIEKYIYDTYPDVKNPLNKFAKRMMIYKNAPCIVIGKNQNIFREINFRYASNIGIPILRRFSGGGTVVHDLGNINFSFMCPKDEFDRVGFTGLLIDAWNSSPAEIKLNINEKGDMINNANSKKVSGSAFQISKGKSLHHGTMLLDSNLKELGKLLKVNAARLEGIKDKSTNSIPSPIMNTGISHDEFISLLCDSFTTGYGLPSNIKNGRGDSNVFVFQRGDSKCQVLLVDDLVKLPETVYETERELKSWEWTFGKTPKFEQQLKGLSGGLLDVKFTVVKGLITELAFERTNGSSEERFGLLERELKEGKEVKFTSEALSMLIEDPKLSQEICWLIDEFYKSSLYK